MEFVKKAEKSLEEPFGALPALPKETRKGLAAIWPWLALIAGILQVAAALSLYNWAKRTEPIAEWANKVSEAYGGGAVSTGFTLWVWLGLAFLLIDGIILLVAFPKLQRKEKAGWDLLLLAALINLAYGVASLFIDGRGGVSGLIGSLVGSAIGLYLLFQVREFFGGKAVVSVPASKKETKKSDNK